MNKEVTSSWMGYGGYEAQPTLPKCFQLVQLWFLNGTLIIAVVGCKQDYPAAPLAR